MTKIRLGTYVYFDAERQSDTLLPLLECLRFAVDEAGPVDLFLNKILTPDRNDGLVAGAGGDPGWGIYWVIEESDALLPEAWKRCMAELPRAARGCFEAWTHQPISELDPPCAYYAEEVVRHHAREVLDNFRTLQPARASEVDEAIERLGLQDA